MSKNAVNLRTQQTRKEILINGFIETLKTFWFPKETDKSINSNASEIRKNFSEEFYRVTGIGRTRYVCSNDTTD